MMTDVRTPYYAAGSDQQGTSTFNLRLPEIYQLEVTNACNFHCDFCPRDPVVTQRKDILLQPELARLISERDLGGSYFVEFQMSGEPLLHPKLRQIISYFRGKVLTGMSTNGYLLDTNLKSVIELDYLTISIDSITNYEKVRKGGNLLRLLENINLLLRVRPSSLAIDLQVIEFPGSEVEVKKLEEIVERRGWKGDVEIRTVPDCFLSMTREYKEIRAKDLCLNPWMSCSVQADGDVTSCCFSFGKRIVYGNLTHKSLEEIWATSEVLQHLRQEHLTQMYRSPCKECYMRSPVLLHWDFYVDVMRRRGNATIKRTNRIP